MKFKTGDKVVVIAGANKGKTGEIAKILKDKNKVIIEGVNIKKKHQKAVQGQEGGIIEIAAPIDASNVAILDGDKASRISYTFDKKGKKVRVATKSGKEIK
jgi:large subunit ribosomal protein L24